MLNCNLILRENNPQNIWPEYRSLALYFSGHMNFGKFWSFFFVPYLKMGIPLPEAVAKFTQVNRQEAHKIRP